MKFVHYIGHISISMFLLIACNGTIKTPAGHEKSAEEKRIEEQYKEKQKAYTQRLEEKRLEEQIKLKEEIEEERKLGFPPKEFVFNLKAKSDVVAKVRLTSVDSIYLSIKILNAVVLKAYKGKVTRGQKISFATMSETYYPENPQDTMHVFLTQSAKPLSSFSPREVYFTTADEIGILRDHSRIDKLLTK